MLHAQANADLMQIHSPLDGVVVLNTIWKQGTMGEVQEGDQVRPGVPFMQVVNPATMQVRVTGQSAGLPSACRSDRPQGPAGCVSGAGVPGEGSNSWLRLARAVDFSSKLRTFAVIVSIEGNDPKLMPDLSAAVDVDIGGTGRHAGCCADCGRGRVMNNDIQQLSVRRKVMLIAILVLAGSGMLLGDGAAR